MLTAIMQFKKRIKNITVKNAVVWISVIFTVFMVIGRIFSGVHWITDIIGGALFSAGIVMMYFSVIKIKLK